MNTQNSRILPQRAATLRGEKFRYHDKFYLFSSNQGSKKQSTAREKKKFAARKKDVIKFCQPPQEFIQDEYYEPESQIFEQQQHIMTYKDLQNDNVSEFPDHYWDRQAFIENNELFSEGQGGKEEILENQPETQMDSEQCVSPHIFFKGSMGDSSFTCPVRDFWKTKYSDLKTSSFPSQFKH